MKRLAWPVLVAMCLAAPVLAHAADGYVVDNVNLRAGPDPSYPLVDQLEAGTEVDVQGCTDGWEWCDVIAYGNRGWIAGNYIQYQYQDQEVFLPSYGAQIGIPIVAFSVGTYWDHYYRDRPFYGDRRNWYNRPYVRHAPPPPPRGFYPGRPGAGRDHDHGDWHGNDNNSYRPGQGAQRPDRVDGHGQDFHRLPYGHADGHSDNRGQDDGRGQRHDNVQPTQGNQRPAQSMQPQGGNQRPAPSQGQGFQRPVQQGQPAGRPMPTQAPMNRPANGQPAPSANRAQPNDHQRARDSNPRDDAARHNDGH